MRSSANIVAVGLVGDVNTLDALCGWQSGTWGYHSDDGSILSTDDVMTMGVSYRQGDVVGVTFDPSSKKLRFSLNGIPVGTSISTVKENKMLTCVFACSVGEVLENVAGQSYPAVSFKVGTSPIEVRVHFGEKEGKGLPFKHEPVSL